MLSFVFYKFFRKAAKDFFFGVLCLQLGLNFFSSVFAAKLPKIVFLKSDHLQSKCVESTVPLLENLE